MQKVCVQGLGFVGAAMAAAISRARDAEGHPAFDVVGVELRSDSGCARVEAINAGRFPFDTTDRTLHEAVSRGRETGNLRATVDPSAYESCDVVVVDVHLDVDFSADPPAARLEGFRGAISSIAERVPAGTLVLVETTVPPGTTEHIVVPLLREGLRRRGLDPDSILVAHSYERVMPGSDYLSSITHFWRVYAGHTDEAAEACRAFLERIIDTGRYPLTRLQRTVESETAKLMENTFRAVNIAFVDEWARFAEAAGMDLSSVIRAIKIRPTHQNLMRPGFGVGGYCLTKDPLLARVGAREFFGLSALEFPFSEAAVRTNQRMPRATLGMLRARLGSLEGKRLLLMGATYREDVADTRYSPSADFVTWAEAEGAVVHVHDPLVDVMEAIGRPVTRETPPLDGFDGVIFAVAHAAYRAIRPAEWLDGARPFVLDANFVLSADQVDDFRRAGCRLAVIGRGDL